MAVSNVNNFQTFSDDVLALLDADLWVPLVGDDGEPEVLSKASHNEVLLDECTVEVHACKYALVILESCNHSTIIIGIEIVSLFVADVGEVVHQLLDCVLNLVLVETALVG